MAIDTEAIKEHVRGILVALGDDPEREGLKETPERVAKMYEEVFEGMNYTNHEIAQMFDKTFDQDLELSGKSDDMVYVRDIEIFSYCEHHMALMYDMKVSVAYIPNGKVIGLSKIARIAIWPPSVCSCRNGSVLILQKSWRKLQVQIRLLSRLKAVIAA